MKSRNKKKFNGDPLKIHPIFFNTFIEAKNSQSKILELCKRYEKVYLIIREEGDMDDPDLLGLNERIKVYAGVAWTQIHELRVEDGWYK